MTLKEVGEEFKANAETVRLWVVRGELPAVRAGRKWLVRRSEVLGFIRSRSGEQLADEQLEPAAPGRAADRGRPPRPPSSAQRLTDSRPGVVERVGG